jgi:hypothetical protein
MLGELFLLKKINLNRKMESYMTKKSVPGIEEVEKMESSGDFEVEKVVEVIDANKDIIHKVEVDEYSISVHLNFGASKHRLVDGIADIYGKFNAYSADMICDNSGRILKFWWDGSARNI